MQDETKLPENAYIAFAVVLALGAIGAISLALFPQYHVWQQGKEGEAALRRADQDRQIKVREAEAARDAAVALANAEIERAKGVAEANKIIGDSLKENESYLRYLWIDSLRTGGNEVIYVPTEAGLPILEAGRRKK